MTAHQYIRLEDTVYFYFASNNTSGSGDDGASPLFDVRLGGAAASAAPVLSGTPDLLTHANFPPGAYEIAIAATDANGFAANATYGVFSTLLVDSQNPTGAVGSFITTPLATSAEVANVGSGSAGAVNIAASEDNASGAIIDSLTKVGTPAGTFANIANEDEVLMSIADAGNDIDWVFGYSVGGARTGASVSYVVNVNNNNDSMLLTVYNHGTTNWDTIAVLNGSGGSNFISGDASLFSAHTGTGTELSKVYVRFENNATTPSLLEIDKCVVSAVNIGQSVGYANGKIWVDTSGGIAGTEAFVNAVADNPVLTWADALTLSASTGLTDFHIINGSTITLSAGVVNFSLFGDNWTLDLNGQNVADAYFQGAHVTGVGISTTEVHFEGCDVTTQSVQIGHYDFCSFAETVTHTLAGDYNYHDCYSKVAGSARPTFAKTAGQAVTVQYRRWSGGINFTGLEATDVMTVSGEMGTIDLGSPAGAVAVEVRGTYKELINVGSAVVNLEGAILGGDVADILEDTGTTIPATLAALNDISVADILTTQMTESYAGDGVVPTLTQALMLIQQKLGDFDISGTTLTVKKLDGSATAAVYTLNNDFAPTQTDRTA